jgi:hypothetical protein
MALSRLLEEVMKLYCDGAIRPYGEVCTYDISDIAKATHALSTGKLDYCILSLQNPDSILNVSIELSGNVKIKNHHVTFV